MPRASLMGISRCPTGRGSSAYMQVQMLCTVVLSAMSGTPLAGGGPSGWCAYMVANDDSRKSMLYML